MVCQCIIPPSAVVVSSMFLVFAELDVGLQRIPVTGMRSGLILQFRSRTNVPLLVVYSLTNPSEQPAAIRVSSGFH